MGVKLDTMKLYPPVSLPVPRGTPMISPLVAWDHAQSWDVPQAEMFSGGGANAHTGSRFVVDMSHDSEDAHLIGHKIDGRVLFPATGYLVLAWKALAKQQNRPFEEVPVVFEDISIHRATILPSAGLCLYHFV